MFCVSVPFASRVCGHRVVVELSNGKKRNRAGGMAGGGGGRGDQRDSMSFRGGAPPPRRPRFDPNDRCYECGERGHYAYNCHRRRSGRGRWVLPVPPCSWPQAHLGRRTCSLPLTVCARRL